MSQEQKECHCTPRLRFPEFAGEKWYKEMLKNIALPITEKADSSCHYPALTLSCEQGLIIQEKYFGKKIAGENCNRYIKVKKNDFIYNDRTTSLSLYGTIKRNNLDVVGIVSPIYKCFCFTSGKNPIYWQYYFDARCHEAEMKSIINEGARSGRFNISVKDFLKIFVVFPDEAEQQKIADCLTSLDDLITAHEQKRDALTQHKKGLMQRLFPAEGETTPRWRFPEFREAGEWTTYCLKEVADVLSGYGFPDKYQGNSMGIYPFYKVSDISASQKKGMYISESMNYVDKKIIDIIKAKLIPQHTIIFAKIGEAIRLNRRSITTRQCVIDNNVAGLKAKDKIVFYLFLYYISCLISMEEYASGVVPAVNKASLESIHVKIPSLPEQQKIADCLSALDERIAAEEAKIAALREHKKGLMQQLFPQ